MPEVFHESPREFWRPPTVQPETGSLPATCHGCRSEFLMGSRFCHVCGASRTPKTHSTIELTWKQISDWLQFLEVLQFHSVQKWFGLSTASLAAFLIGVGCVLCAMLVGMFYSVQTIADFQAIQLWRIEWLLASVAAFMAGILLKKSGSAPKK